MFFVNSGIPSNSIQPLTDTFRFNELTQSLRKKCVIINKTVEVEVKEVSHLS